MAGTTMRDLGEVEACFAETCRQLNLGADDATIKAVQGQEKRSVFRRFWADQLGIDHPDLEAHTDAAFARFKQVLEEHYRRNPVAPTEGCLDFLRWCQQQQIKTALTTGFYREVTDILLAQLGWLQHLDKQYIGYGDSLIGFSISSDQVPSGRPAPDMILRAMLALGINDPQAVVNVGDTPSDLLSGKNAGVAFSVGLTNGTHTVQQLAQYPNDGLFGSLTELQGFLNQHLTQSTL